MKLDFPWTVAVCAAAVSLTAAASAGWDVSSLTATSASAWQPWRLVTGSLLHTNANHLLRDISMLALIGVVWERSLGRVRFPILMLLALAVPAAATLIANPEFPAYYGTSGAVNALLAAAFIHEARAAGGMPLWAKAAAAAWLGKLGFEAVTGRLLFSMDLGLGVVAAPVSHLSGVAAGVIASLRFPVGQVRHAAAADTIEKTAAARKSVYPWSMS